MVYALHIIVVRIAYCVTHIAMYNMHEFLDLHITQRIHVKCKMGMERELHKFVYATLVETGRYS